jgi:hypothetical protein
MTHVRRRTVSSADRQRRHRRRLSNGKVVVPVEIDDVAVPLALRLRPLAAFLLRLSAFGGKADMPIALQMSAFDPKRTCSDCGPMFAFGVKADINSGTTPALGSYEGGGYERRQDEGR